MKVIGLDISLTRTGMSVHNKDGHCYTCSISSSPKDASLNRIDHIFSTVNNAIEKGDVVFIEEMITGKMANSGKSVERAKLVGLIEYTLWYKGILFYTIHPKSLKKWVTGSGGKGEKSVILHLIAKKTGYEATNDDEADAYALADLGCHLMFPDKPRRKLLTYEIDFLKKYAKEKGIE